MHQLVDLRLVSPSILLDIRYATQNNILGRPVYRSARCFLMKKTAQRLHRVQKNLLSRGMGLKVFDGYRPLSVQKLFWDFMPDPRFFADPAVGSNHNRGASVDLTLVDDRKTELMMPSGFDEMTERAHLHYQGGEAKACQNRQILVDAMSKEGFLPCIDEWWHFDDPDWKLYPILDIPIEEL